MAQNPLTGSLHDPSARIELDLARAGVQFLVDNQMLLTV